MTTIVARRETGTMNIIGETAHVLHVLVKLVREELHPTKGWRKVGTSTRMMDLPHRERRRIIHHAVETVSLVRINRGLRFQVRP